MSDRVGALSKKGITVSAVAKITNVGWAISHQVPKTSLSTVRL